MSGIPWPFISEKKLFYSSYMYVPQNVGVWAAMFLTVF
jgi:hypothetical protein